MIIKLRLVLKIGILLYCLYLGCICFGYGNYKMRMVWFYDWWLVDFDWLVDLEMSCVVILDVREKILVLKMLM